MHTNSRGMFGLLAMLTIAGTACGEPEEASSGEESAATTTLGTTSAGTTGGSDPEGTTTADETTGDEMTTGSTTVGGDSEGETEGETDDEPLCVPGVESACYPGREGSAGVAMCQEGAAICADDGASYGECVGAVVPSTEVCESLEDENCDGFVGCDGAIQWNIGYRGHKHAFGQTSNDAALTVDTAGEVWIAQSFFNSLEFAGETLTAGSSNTFLAKLSPSGEMRWIRTIGSDEPESALTVKGMLARPGGGVAVIAEFLGPEPRFAGSTLPTTHWAPLGPAWAAGRCADLRGRA